MESGDELDHRPGLTPEAVEEADFATVRRGFDPKAVRARLSEAAAEIRRLDALVGSLSERISELEEAPPAQLDSNQLTEALGDEAARVLQTAREAAQEQIDRAAAECDRMTDEAKAAAEAVIEESRTEGRAMVAEAGKVRERILADLAGKRHQHRVEVEQLRVMRDRFMEALTICRQGLDGWMGEVAQAEPQAVAAAERAGQRVAAEREPTVGEIEAEIKAGRMMGLPLGGGPDSAASGGAAAEADPDEAAGAGHPSDAAPGGAHDADRLEDLDESEELDEGVEMVGYPRPSSASGSVGLYDVEAEPEPDFDSDFDSALDAGTDAGTALADEPPSVAADGPSEPAEPVPATAGVDAEAIFARLRSIADRPIDEPKPPPEDAGRADTAAAPTDLRAVDAPAVAAAPTDPRADATAPTALADAEASEPDDLVSAARAVAVGGIARRLKRMVVDEQGSLLDGIRRGGARAARATLSADTGHYARAARVPMQDFASDIDVSIDDVDLKAAGDAIVSMLVEPVRARLADLLEIRPRIPTSSAEASGRSIGRPAPARRRTPPEMLSRPGGPSRYRDGPCALSTPSRPANDRASAVGRLAL